MPRKRKKRARIAHVRRRKRTKSKIKMVVPIIVSPRNLCVVSSRSNAMPPVDIVRVNHAQVKWWRRSLRETV